MLRSYHIDDSLILKNSHIDDDNKMIFFITFIIGIFGLLIHLLLLFFFYHIGIIEMVYFNVISILMWSLGIYLNYTGFHTYAIYSFNTEVLLHSILATMYMGTDSGFQFYLWSISALYILDFKLSNLQALVMSLLLIVVFAFLYLLFSEVDIHYEYIHILNFSNIIISGTPLIFALVMIRDLYSDRELKLEDEGMKDSLTKLYNRSYIFKKAIFEFKQLDNINNPIIVVMCDIDLFKSVNDSYGHAEGDCVLQKISTLLKESFRESDTLVRWGGEEFLILLHNTNIQQAYQTIEVIRKKIFDTINVQENPSKKISMSFGISQLEDFYSLENAISQADEALYHSKNSGRNKVTVFTNKMKL